MDDYTKFKKNMPRDLTQYNRKKLEKEIEDKNKDNFFIDKLFE
jgi:hypothetical protein